MPFYEITCENKHGNLDLFKKQWERNFFSAPVGIALHCLRNAGGRPKGKYITVRHCTRVVAKSNPSAMFMQCTSKHLYKSYIIFKLKKR